MNVIIHHSDGFEEINFADHLGFFEQVAGEFECVDYDREIPDWVTGSKSCWAFDAERDEWVVVEINDGPTEA